MTIRRVLLAGAAVLGALILVTAVAVYLRDGRTMRRAGEAVLRINEFCSSEGRLPDTAQLADLFPDLSPGAGWYYWPSTDRRQATLQ